MLQTDARVLDLPVARRTAQFLRQLAALREYGGTERIALRILIYAYRPRSRANGS